jgi:hypothetical protein
MAFGQQVRIVPDGLDGRIGDLHIPGDTADPAKPASAKASHLR